MEFGKWTPYGGELPKECKNYLITYRTRTGRLLVNVAYCEYVGMTPYHADFSKKVNGKIIAWMPLPEPYRGK